MPNPLLKDGGPVHLETTVMQRGVRTIVHLMSFIPSRKALEGLDLVRDPIPLVDMPLSIRAAKAPKSVTMQPDGQALAFEYSDGRMHASAR